MNECMYVNFVTLPLHFACFLYGSFNMHYNSWKMQHVKPSVGNKMHSNSASGSREGREFHV